MHEWEYQLLAQRCGYLNIGPGLPCQLVPETWISLCLQIDRLAEDELILEAVTAASRAEQIMGTFEMHLGSLKVPTAYLGLCQWMINLNL